MAAVFPTAAKISHFLNFNHRMRKQLRGTAKRELTLACGLLICISEDQ